MSSTFYLGLWFFLLGLEVINLIGLPHYLPTLLGYARIPILVACFIVGSIVTYNNFSWWYVGLLALPILTLLLEFRNPIAKELIKLGQHQASTFTIYQLNVCYSNNDMSGVVAQIIEKSPDVVILCETNAKWISYLRAQFEDSEYSLFIAGEGTRKKDTGRVTLTRFPLMGKPEYIEQTNAYDIITHIEVGGQVVSVFNIHPEACLGYAKFNQQKADWNNLFTAVDIHQGNHIIICGDFNVTPWHYYYRKLVKHLPYCYDELLNVLCFTFPAWLGAFMFLNLDHCLVSDNVYIVKQVRCVGVNSDHYPVLTTVSL